MLQENKRLRRREADMRQQMALLQEQVSINPASPNGCYESPPLGGRCDQIITSDLPDSSSTPTVQQSDKSDTESFYCKVN